MRLHDAGTVEDFKDGEPRLVNAGSTEIGVYRFRGKYYAYENICSHQGGPACEGGVFENANYAVDGRSRQARLLSEERSNIACPWHGVEYDITTGICRADKRLRLRPFKVFVKDGIVRVLA